VQPAAAWKIGKQKTANENQATSRAGDEISARRGMTDNRFVSRVSQDRGAHL